jgi:hypothetical protein
MSAGIGNVVEICGGEVKVTGGGKAINVFTYEVRLKGGAVSAPTGIAIDAKDIGVKGGGTV